MSYPEPKYVGEGGEVSASLRRADAPPELTLGSQTVHHLSTSSSTGGLFGLYRWEMDGSRSGAQPHFHRSFTESFYVLTGSVQVHDGVRWTDAGPGDFLFVPEGGIHGFRNVSGEPASMLLLFAPGAPRERYFEGLKAMGRMSEEERIAFMVEHDNHLV